MKLAKLLASSFQILITYPIIPSERAGSMVKGAPNKSFEADGFAAAQLQR
jgi:hypothetical protein